MYKATFNIPPYIPDTYFEVFPLSIFCNILAILTIYYSFNMSWNITPLCLCLCYFFCLKHTLLYIHLSNSNVTFILFLTLLSLILNQPSLKWWEVLRVAAKLHFNFKFPNQCLEINNPFLLPNPSLQLNSPQNWNFLSENFNFFELADNPISVCHSENSTSREIGDNCEILGR